MRVVIQRVKEASVSVNAEVINEIKTGFMLLVSFTQTDTLEKTKKMAQKIANIRIFPDENGVMNKSILDNGGSILSISQFTLYAETKKGNRPSYINALNGSEAIKLYEAFNEEMNTYVPTFPGVFGADMQVSLINDGPVTILLEV